MEDSATLRPLRRPLQPQDIRHLPVVDDAKKEVVGMLSIKDLIKELQKEKDDIITKLSDFNIGKGAFFEHSKCLALLTVVPEWSSSSSSYLTYIHTYMHLPYYLPTHRLK